MTREAGWYSAYPGDDSSRRWWDGQAWTERYAIWDSDAGQWQATDTPPPPPLPINAPNAQSAAIGNVERTLLEMTAIGKGASMARIRVTTRMLEIWNTQGVSAWRTLLMMGTAGVTAIATGITRRGDGTLEVPISIVDAVYVANERGPWADLRIIVAGESATFNMSSAGATVAARAINAAVAGGHEADIHHEAWSVSRGKRSEKPRHARARLREELRDGVIDQAAHDRARSVMDIESGIRLMF